jgi:uncharacterized protein (TIGR00730 family)
VIFIMQKKKRTIKDELNDKNFRVAIFGSARIQRGKPQYREVETLAWMLGERGIDIVTGGGPGLMEAANKGHSKGSKKSKNNSHSIGLGIRLPKEQSFNKHLDIKKEYKTFTNRLDNFMLLSNAVVVAPGGVGTLLELFYTWQLVQVEHVCNIPIILLGKQWAPLVDWLEKYPLKNKFLSKHDMGLIFLADNCNDAVKMIEASHREFKKGNKDFCLNYKKYKLY